MAQAFPEPHRQADRPDPVRQRRRPRCRRASTRSTVTARSTSTARSSRPVQTALAGQQGRRSAGRNGDLPSAAGDAGRGPVAGRDHPRRLQPRLCAEPREDAAHGRSRQPAGALASERRQGRQRERRAAEHRDDGSRAPRPARRASRSSGLGIGPEDHAQVAAGRRLGGRPDRQQDRGRVRLSPTAPRRWSGG